MSIQTSINKVIATRQSSKSEFAEAKSRLEDYRKNVDLFCALNNSNEWMALLRSLPENDRNLFQIAATKASEIKDKIESLVSSDISSVGELDRVLDRIERGEFHFCFMGAWRQGKSFVLDKLLNLGQYIAPNVNLGACTGTVVSIINVSSTKIK